MAREIHDPTALEPLVVSVEAAARLLSISRNHAYLAVKRGDIPTIRVGRRILVPKAALDRMLEEASKRATE